MTKVDWFYHRKGWTTSAKTQEFLAKHKIEPKQIDFSNKLVIKEDEAAKIFKEVDHIYARKGAKSIHIDLRKEKLDPAIAKKFLFGPTGNLRAPIVKKGKALLVGFDEESYREVLL